jgi:OmpA-OmpF porin, OOP family
MLKFFFLCSLLVICNIEIFAQTTVLKADDKNALIHVNVTDMDHKSRNNDIIVFYGTAQKKSFEGISNAEGNFDILLPKGDIYEIMISGLGSEQAYNSIEIGNEDGIYEASIQIGYEPASVFTLEDVYFEVNKAILRPESFKSLDKLTRVLKVKDDIKIEIAGHTDSDGTEEANLILSQARAEAVLKYLHSKGIDRNRLSAKGYGESEPIADNESPEGKQMNRRTEVRILE